MPTEKIRQAVCIPAGRVLVPKGCYQWEKDVSKNDSKQNVTWRKMITKIKIFLFFFNTSLSIHLHINQRQNLTESCLTKTKVGNIPP